MISDTKGLQSCRWLGMSCHSFSAVRQFGQALHPRPTPSHSMNKRNVLLFVLALLGGWLFLSFPRGSHTAAIAPSDSKKADSKEAEHDSGYQFIPIPPAPVVPDPPGTNAGDQQRLASLIRSIEEDGKPGRDQGIVARAYASKFQSEL